MEGCDDRITPVRHSHTVAVTMASVIITGHSDDLLVTVTMGDDHADQCEANAIITMVSVHMVTVTMVNVMLTLFSVMMIYVDGQECDDGQCNDGQ